LKPVFFGGPFELDKDREIGLDGGSPPSLWSREDIAMLSWFETNGVLRREERDRGAIDTRELVGGGKIEARG
jgi:hypothetical protein